MKQIHLLFLLAVSVFLFGCTSVLEENDFGYATLKITSVEVVQERVYVEASFQYENIDPSTCKFYIFAVNDSDLAEIAPSIELLKRSELALNQSDGEPLSKFLKDNKLSFNLGGFNPGFKMHLYLVVVSGDYEVGSQKLADSEIVSFTVGKSVPYFAEDGKISYTNLTTSSAQLSTAILSTGGSAITSCGFCYSTAPNPTTANSKVMVNDYSSFTATLPDLQTNTTYYVRAFATNSAGTSYSKEVSFRLEAPLFGSIEHVTSLATTASLSVTISTDGGSPIIARGVCYGTTPLPTLSNTKTANGSGTGSFTASLSGLQSGTLYYARAYATNSAGTHYGAQISFRLEDKSPMDMIQVKGGTFQMGGTSEQGSDAESDEKPVHSVTLSDYSIGKYEVTQELWEAVMGSNPSYYKGANLPVESVHWGNCQTFIQKLNQMTGKQFRLPTEAEWEYAARGGNKSKGYKYSGSNTLGDVAWYADNSGNTTHAVGTKQPNELGIYDMSGNVWEWCNDWYGSYTSGSLTNPTGPSTGSCRVFRGGSWYFNEQYCRSAFRNNRTPAYLNSRMGFRLVLRP